MKIKPQEFSDFTSGIEEYTAYILDGDCPHPWKNVRRSEVALCQARNNSFAIGRLLDILAEKGILTAPEVVQVVKGYKHQSDAIFTS